MRKQQKKIKFVKFHFFRSVIFIWIFQFTSIAIFLHFFVFVCIPLIFHFLNSNVLHVFFIFATNSYLFMLSFVYISDMEHVSLHFFLQIFVQWNLVIKSYMSCIAKFLFFCFIIPLVLFGNIRKKILYKYVGRTKLLFVQQEK